VSNGDAGAAPSAGELALAVRAWLAEREEAMLRDLSALVSLDSPSTDARLLGRTADWLIDWWSPLATPYPVVTLPGSAPHLLIELQNPRDRAPLVLCHYDTVWSEGTAERWPFALAGEHACGPGVLDMKASIVLVRYALEGLLAVGGRLDRGIRVLLTADEEIHNPTSRALITELAQRSCAALVMEPALSDGRLKTQRKGHASVHVTVVGRSAHAGVEPEAGTNAAIEAAHVALAADALGDREAGTLVNVGVIRGGERPNIVPATAELEIEVRADSEVELGRVFEGLRRLNPVLPGARIEMAVEIRRPPMPRARQTDHLVALARHVGEALDMSIDEGATGGVSEGNFTQAVGTPTLDGLGVVGRGAHTPDERVLVSSLFERTALHAGMLAALSGVDHADGPWSLDMGITSAIR